jgi:hypothetical protein
MSSNGGGLRAGTEEEFGMPSLLTAQPTARRVSKRLAEAVNLLLDGGCKTQKEAAARVGLNSSYLCEALKKPHVKVFIDRRIRETISAGTMRASARIIELLESGSDHVSLDASKHLLGIAGIKPAAEPQVALNIHVKAGYVIDLSEPDEKPVVEAKANR